MAYVLVVAATLAYVHTRLLVNKTAICYSVAAADDVISKVYWSHTGSFTEGYSKESFVSGSSEQTLCLQAREMAGLKQVRLDPVDAATDFSVSNIAMKRQDLLWPWREIFSVPMRLEDAIEQSAIEALPAGHEYRFRSLGNDPSWSLRAPGLSISGKTALLLNLVTVLSLMGILTAVWIVTRGKGRIPKLSVLGTLTLGFGVYASYLILAYLAHELAYLEPFSGQVIYATCLLLALSLLITRTGRIRARWMISVSVLTLMGLLIFIDVAFRLGIVRRPVFEVTSHSQYHWTLGRQPSDSFKNSSMPYYGEFLAVSEVIPSGAHVLSDMATSYYLSAALPVYAVNVHPHHYRHHLAYDEFIEAVCAKNDAVELRSRLRKAEAYLRSNKQHPADYLVINGDKVNKNVKNNCLSKSHDDTRSSLSEIFDLVYEGNYLTVYKI